MTDPETLARIKERLLLGAESAHRIATSNDPFVLHDEEQYRLVATALAYMPNDVRLVLAELDILRGMFSERLAAFFQQAANGVTANGTSTSDVEAVSDAPAAGGSEEARADDEGVGGGVSAARPVRKRKGRSKPSRDSGGVPADTSDVGRGDGA